MPIGPIIALIAAFGGPLATKRERIVEIKDEEPFKDPFIEAIVIPPALGEGPIPEEILEEAREEFGESVGAKVKSPFEAVEELGGEAPPLEVFIETILPPVREALPELIPDEPFVSKPVKFSVEGETVQEQTTFGTEGQTQTIVDESTFVEATKTTSLTAGELFVAQQSADLLGISLEESIRRIEEQKASLPQTEIQTQFKFSVGETLTFIAPHPIRGVQGSHFLVTATPATTLIFRFGGEPVYSGRFIDGPWAGTTAKIPESKLQ